jgi:hypothetical protein
MSSPTHSHPPGESEPDLALAQSVNSSTYRRRLAIYRNGVVRVDADGDPRNFKIDAAAVVTLLELARRCGRFAGLSLFDRFTKQDGIRRVVRTSRRTIRKHGLARLWNRAAIDALFATDEAIER